LCEKRTLELLSKSQLPFAGNKLCLVLELSEMLAYF
jgi:hypothetical protein